MAAPKAEKPKKPKLVRDSFTIPKIEYKVLQDSKDRAAALGRPVKKSELLRAGLKALAGMSDEAFVSALGGSACAQDGASGQGLSPRVVMPGLTRHPRSLGTGF